jgi:hypothetical protein
MKRVWMWKMLVAFLAFITVGGLVVRELWNWLLPSLFGARSVTFWQALGILALSRILFGGFGVGGRGSGRKRWERMTPEDRERLRDRVSGGGAGSAPSTSVEM